MSLVQWDNADQFDSLRDKVNAAFTQVDTNTDNIATNTSDIATNTSDIATNTSDIATINQTWTTTTVAATNPDSTALGSKTVSYVKNNKTATVAFSVSVVAAGGSTGIIRLALPASMIATVNSYASLYMNDVGIAQVTQVYMYVTATLGYLYIQVPGLTYTNGHTYAIVGQITFGCN